MNDKTPTALDRLLGQVPVGQAPIGDLLTAGHAAKRRQRRTLLGGVIAATVLVLGGGTIATQALNDSNGQNNNPVADGSPGTVGDLRVRVEHGVAKEVGAVNFDMSSEFALWDTDSQSILYVSDLAYSSSCLPTANADLAKDGALTLDVNDYEGPGECLTDEDVVTVLITGLNQAPPAITIDDKDKTRTLPIRQRDGDGYPFGGVANKTLAVGDTGELGISLHCGLQYATIDGTVWETNPRGGSSAPDGWPESVTGTATRTAEDTVIFSNAWIDRLVFHPATHPEKAVCF